MSDGQSIKQKVLGSADAIGVICVSKQNILTGDQVSCIN